MYEAAINLERVVKSGRGVFLAKFNHNHLYVVYLSVWPRAGL
jgi:hypothetical protein